MTAGDRRTSEGVQSAAGADAPPAHAPTLPAPGDVLAVPDPSVFTPITIDDQLCIGCNLCVLVCQADLFLPSPVKGGAPTVFYGSECWYEGSCVDHCPVPGAITLNWQLFNRVHWEESRHPQR